MFSEIIRLKKEKKQLYGSSIKYVYDNEWTYWIPRSLIYSYKRKHNWDIFVTFLALFNSIYTPLVMCYSNYPIMHLYLFVVIDFTIDMIFLLDLMSMFFATYVDNKVTDKNK